MKKVKLIVIMMYTLWLCHEKAYAQNAADFIFKYEISVNGSTPSAILTGVPAGIGGVYGNGNVYWSTTQGSIPSLCPGDFVTIKNLCTYEGNHHSFNGLGTGSFGTNSYGRATIGLTSRAGCTNYGQITIPPNSVTRLGDVCQGAQCLTPGISPVTWNDWNYGTTKTVTIPSFTSTTGQQYLMISAWLLPTVPQTQPVQTHTPQCHQSVPYCFTEIDGIGTISDPIADQTICPNESIDLGLNPSYTYTNWSPSNPETTPPSVTTNYTVDISNNSSCAPLHDEFTVTVNEPDAELLNDSEICSYDLPYSINPFNSSTSPSRIWVNGVLEFDLNSGLFNNVIINSIGTFNIVYEYFVDENLAETCTKEYTFVVYRAPKANLGSTIYLCSADVMPILDPISGLGLGLTYNWTFTAVGSTIPMYIFGSPSTVNTANYGYGKYTVTVMNSAGCSSSSTVNVLLNPSAYNNVNADFVATQTNVPASISATSNQSGNHYWYIYSSNSSTGPWNLYTTYAFMSSINLTGLQLGTYYKVSHGLKQKPCNELKFKEYVYYIGFPKSGGIRRITSEGGNEPETYELENLIKLVEKSEASSLGIKEVSIYPNPTSGIFNVEFSQDTENTTVEVLNLMGKVIFNENVTTSKLTLDLSNEAKGIYLVKITTNGNTTIEKVVYQ